MDVQYIIEEGRREVKKLLDSMQPKNTDAFEEAIINANRIFFTGAGRSGLMVRSFAVRLMQLGYAAYIVGDDCTPSIRAGDLLIVASSSGEKKSIMYIAQKAKEAGAKVALITQSKESSLARMSDILLCFTAVLKQGAPTTDGWNLNDYTSVRTFSAAFEQSIVALGDAIACRLMIETKISLSVVYYNASNLE